MVFTPASDGPKCLTLPLALLNEVLHGAGSLFDGHICIAAVLIEQIDDIGLEALERGLRDFLDMMTPYDVGELLPKNCRKNKILSGFSS